MKSKTARVSSGMFIAVAAVFFILCGCHNSIGQESQGLSAKTIEVRVGKNAVITLESNHSTGFQWQLAKPLETDIIEFKNTEYVPSNTGRIGAGGKEVWTFKTLKKGKVEISLIYVRPWEKDKPPARQEAFVIIVK